MLAKTTISDVVDRLVCANVYLGARPIAESLTQGARVVLTGRVADASLTLGPAASFGAFTAGVAKDYTTSTTANVISSAENAALTVSDPGRMMNGTYALPSPLEVTFSKSAWTAPTSNEAVAIDFKQHIGATDALRTGSYSKTLTFTLSTTTP